jgi:cytochrome c oxidase subunit 2
MLEGWPPPILDPAGPYATSVSVLSWILFGMAVVVMLIVLLSLWLALFGRQTTQAKLGGKRLIWVGGVAFPFVVLTLLLIYGLTLTRSLSDPITGDEMRIRVTGEMWWWRVTYLDRAGQEIVHDANEIHIPVGRPVVLELESADVIHSFWVPRLSGKLDMIPGRRNLLRIQSDRVGVFGGQCAEYCGGPHALMGISVVAHEPAAFARLIAARRNREEATVPASSDSLLFDSAGCAACHRIAGTGANGLAGPDLTYVGARGSLGAGVLANNRGTMMGWIANSQAIKPNNRMPAYTVLSADELKQLAAYLEAQK